MKKIFLLATLGLLICSNIQHPDYAKSEITKQWFEVFVTQDLDATMDFYADELEYQRVLSRTYNEQQKLENIFNWQDAMEIHLGSGKLSSWS